MKKFKILFILLIGLILTGCESDFEGTWCKYSDISTTLVIFKQDATSNQINEVANYVSKISNLKSYDIIDKIEESSKMITIYYKNDENITEYENKLKTFNQVSSVKSEKLNQVVDKLLVNSGNYTYDKSLNDLSATEVKGKYKIEGKTLKLEDGTNFYYKDKFLCYDEGCTSILTKSKTSECQ